MILLFNKPYGVITQFSASGGKPTLKDFIPVPAVYPAGCLDTDSEGLLILTDDGRAQARISDPRHKLPKTYWVQVEGAPADVDLEPLRRGIELRDFTALPAEVSLIAQPEGLWPRDPPVRFRAAIPTAWLAMTIREGKNRQVRKMTAQAGFPTLRLIRWSVGGWTIAGLAPGAWRILPADEAQVEGAFRKPHRRNHNDEP